MAKNAEIPQFLLGYFKGKSFNCNIIVNNICHFPKKRPPKITGNFW